MTTDIPPANEPVETGTYIAELEQIAREAAELQREPSFEGANHLVRRLEETRGRMESAFVSRDVPLPLSQTFLCSVIALERLLVEVNVDWDRQNQLETASWREIMTNVHSFADRLLQAISLPSSVSQPRETADTRPVNRGRSQKMKIPDIQYDTFLQAVGGCHDAWDSLLMHADFVKLPALRSILANVIAAHRGLRRFLDENKVENSSNLWIRADRILKDFLSQFEAVADGTMSWQDYASASRTTSGVTNPFYGLIHDLKKTRQKTGATETD